VFVLAVNPIQQGVDPRLLAIIEDFPMKKPNLKKLGFLYLVELAGFEPASVSHLRADLHV
jgi:hypothetical protein